jgi:hypothetical protein
MCNEKGPGKAPSETKPIISTSTFSSQHAESKAWPLCDEGWLEEGHAIGKESTPDDARCSVSQCQPVPAAVSTSMSNWA